MNPPANPQLEEVRQAIFAGRKIEAIKLHREATGAGLKESKEAVEHLEAELRRTDAHRFAAGAGKAGCFSLVLMTLLFSAAVLIARASLS